MMPAVLVGRMKTMTGRMVGQAPVVTLRAMVKNRKKMMFPKNMVLAPFVTFVWQGPQQQGSVAEWQHMLTQE